MLELEDDPNGREGGGDMWIGGEGDDNLKKWLNTREKQGIQLRLSHTN